MEKIIVGRGGRARGATVRVTSRNGVPTTLQWAPILVVPLVSQKFRCDQFRYDEIQPDKQQSLERTTSSLYAKSSSIEGYSACQDLDG